MTDQFTLDMPHRPALGRDDFWVTNSNEHAVDFIDSWPQWPGPALLLTGPRGSGKTHLAEVWRKASGAELIKAEQLDVDNVPDLLARGAVVVEDAPGAALDEKALFHLLNLAREQTAHVLLTARELPNLWNVALPDLLTRLNALTLARLNEPDDILLRAVLVKLFADRQVVVDEGVVEFLVVRMERALGAAHDLVAELDGRALAEKSAITRPFAAKVLKEQGL
jgi:chromosomal replication initiation ATPase DnaA